MMSHEQPGDPPGDSDDAMRGAQSSAAEPAQPSGPAEKAAVPNSMYHGFSVQRGGRNMIADTAERLGRVAGAAHRQVRRGLELVRPAGPIGGSSLYGYGRGSTGNSNALEQERDEQMAARVMQSIEDEIAEVRHEAAHRLGEFGEVASESLLQLREGLHAAVSRSRRLVTDYPVQTMAAVASFCIAFGATLLVHGSRRR